MLLNQILAQAGDLQAMPPFEAVRSRLERRRASLMPAIPHTVRDVAIGGEWAVSWGGDEFLSKHNVPHGYVVFGTEDNFRKLSQCRQVRTNKTSFISVKIMLKILG